MRISTFAGFLFLSTLFTGMSGCFTLDIGTRVADLKEYTVEDRDVDEKVAVVDISGVMTSAGEDNLLYKSENIVARTKEQLDRAAKDEDVRAVVLRVSSPGGEVYPSLAVYQELKRFRKKTGKPVIAYVPELAASGGYLAALGADEIVADRAAITGSVGVIAMLPEFSGLLEVVKVKVHTLKAGKHKDLGNPFREMSEEDRAELYRLINYYFEFFKGIVDESRPKLSREQVDKLADGSIKTSDNALKSGMIDAIGDLSDAHERAAKKAGLSAEKTNLVIYRRPREYHKNVYASAPQRGSKITLDLNQLSPLTGIKFLFLWSPGGAF
jgi:protease-4